MNIDPEKNDPSKGDVQLDQLLDHADPASDDHLSSLGFDLSRSCDEIANKVSGLNEEQIRTAHPKKATAQKPSFGYVLRNLALAASLIGILFATAVFWPTGQRDKLRSASVDPESGKESIKSKTVNEAGESKNENVPKPKDSVAGAKKPASKTITTADQLLALTAAKRWKLRRLIDQDALREELGQWLENWINAEPTDKKELEEKFIANKSIWLPIVRQNTGQWKKQHRNRGGLLVLVKLKDPIAEYKLRELRKDRREKSFCNEILYAALPDQKLAEEIQYCQSCEDLDQLLRHISKRKHSTCSDIAIAIAGTQGCSSRIKNVATWNKDHIQRAIQTLRSSDSARKTAAIQFLVLAKSKDTDNLLAGALNRGRSTLPVIQVLLSRETTAAKSLRQKIFRSRNLAAYLPSAQMALARTKLPYKQFNSKVCQSCTNL